MKESIPAIETKAIEKIIINRIESILESVYDVKLSEHNRAGVFSHLAFRSDPHLNELRLALERMERGEFGTCIFCKDRIDLETLKELPTAHFCRRCSSTLRDRVLHSGS